MSIPVVAFFNNKGGVGKTSLVYHLAWMYAELGFRVVGADLDPQANLSAAFLDEDRLEQLWPEEDHPNTIFGCVQPTIRGTGDIDDPHLEIIEDNDNLALLIGDLLLSGFEDQLSEQWPKLNSYTKDVKEKSIRVISAFWRIMQKAGVAHQADVILMDLGPNLGAINRAALIGADFVVVPLSPDLFSLQGLKNLGPTLEQWRGAWIRALEENVPLALELPKGRMEPVGYIVLQHSVRLDRPVKAYDRWIAKIPGIYREKVLEKSVPRGISVYKDPYCLALLKHYRSLVPLAQEARKPIFKLKSADGAAGGNFKAVQEAYQDFQKLAREIAKSTGLALPEPEEYHSLEKS